MHKQVPSSHAHEYHEWATHVLQLLQVKTPLTSRTRRTANAQRTHAAKSTTAKSSLKQTQTRLHAHHTRNRAPGSTVASDAFGMPELVWPGEGKGFGNSKKVVDLKSRWGCGAACQKQAQMLAQNMIPTD